MPRIFTVAEAMAIVRSKLSLGQEVGLLLYAQEKYLLQSGQKLEEIHERYADRDGFLYLTYAE